MKQTLNAPAKPKTSIKPGKSLLSGLGDEALEFPKQIAKQFSQNVKPTPQEILSQFGLKPKEQQRFPSQETTVFDGKGARQQKEFEEREKKSRAELIMTERKLRERFSREKQEMTVEVQELVQEVREIAKEHNIDTVVPLERFPSVGKGIMSWLKNLLKTLLIRVDEARSWSNMNEVKANSKPAKGWDVLVKKGQSKQKVTEAATFTQLQG